METDKGCKLCFILQQQMQGDVYIREEQNLLETSIR